MAKLFLDKIPQALKDTARWCCWRLQSRPGDDKPTKVPYNPLTGYGAKSNDRNTFARFGQACMALDMHGYDGLGIGIFDDLCVIDLDHCIDEDGSFSDLSAEIISDMNTYAEISPGGDGVHLYFRAPGLVYNKEKYYIKNPKNGVEIYVAGVTKRFITVTGNALTDAGLNDRTEQLQMILDRYMVREVQQKRTMPAGTPAVKLTMSDEQLIRLASSAKNGDTFKRLMAGDVSMCPKKKNGEPDLSSADLSLCNILAFWTSRDAGQIDRIFRTSGLMRPKWDRPTAGSTYGAITIDNAINFVESTYTDRYIERCNKDRQPMPVKPKRDGGSMYGW